MPNPNANIKNPRDSTAHGGTWSPMDSKHIEVSVRRQFVLDCRISGMSPREIVAASIKYFGRDRLPDSWDEHSVYLDVYRAMKALKSDMGETADQIRFLELQRLDQLQSSIWNTALGEDTSTKEQLQAIDRVLKLMDRRAKLLGLDIGDIITNLNVDVDELIDSADEQELERILDGDFMSVLIDRARGDSPPKLPDDEIIEDRKERVADVENYGESAAATLAGGSGTKTT